MDSREIQENNLKASIKPGGKFNGVTGEESSENDSNSNAEKKSDSKATPPIGKSSSSVSKN